MDRCLVCRKEIPPLFQKTIHPPLLTSHGIRIRFVKPGFVFPGPSDGQTLFVCKKPCFSKLEQGMSKVTAVETIVRDLRGPADDASLSLSGVKGPAGSANRTAVYANACTQTEPVPVESLQTTSVTFGKRRAATETATASIGKKQKQSSGSSVRESSPSTPVSLLGKRRLGGCPQASRAKRCKALDPVSLSALLDKGETEPVVSIVRHSSPTLAEHSPSRQQIDLEGTAVPLASTPVSRRQTGGVQFPHSLIKVCHYPLV
jgi:hypothetical protein